MKQKVLVECTAAGYTQESRDLSALIHKVKEGLESVPPKVDSVRVEEELRRISKCVPLESGNAFMLI